MDFFSKTVEMTRRWEEYQLTEVSKTEPTPKAMVEAWQEKGKDVTKLNFLIKKLEGLERRFEKEFSSPPKNPIVHAWGLPHYPTWGLLGMGNKKPQ